MRNIKLRTAAAVALQSVNFKIIKYFLDVFLCNSTHFTHFHTFKELFYSIFTHSLSEREKCSAQLNGAYKIWRLRFMISKKIHIFSATTITSDHLSSLLQKCRFLCQFISLFCFKYNYALFIFIHFILYTWQV